MASYTPGKSQIAILTTIVSGNWFRAETRQHYTSCLRLNEFGFVRRHPKDSMQFMIAPAGLAWVLAWITGQMQGAPA